MNSGANEGRGMDTLWLLSIYRILGGLTHVWWIFSTLTHNYLHSNSQSMQVANKHIRCLKQVPGISQDLEGRTREWSRCNIECCACFTYTA